MTPSVNTQDFAAALHEIVQRRRSVYAYRDEPVAREVLELALAAAMRAPNHHRTVPWRFFVIEESHRERLVRAYEAAAARLGRDVARATQRAKDAPVNVIVACVPAVDNPRVVVREEEFATAAAVQNFLLALAASGVDTLLTTGDLAESAEVAQLIGLHQPGSRVMGVINVGYRNPDRPIQPRPSPDIFKAVKWVGEDLVSSTPKGKANV